MNLPLRLELIKRFGTQVSAAKELGIRENRLSYIIRGHVKPSNRERKALQRTLGQALVRRLVK